MEEEKGGEEENRNSSGLSSVLNILFSLLFSLLLGMTKVLVLSLFFFQERFALFCFWKVSISSPA